MTNLLAQIEKKKCKIWQWAIILIVAYSLFLFFELVIPYHFFHKEQISLFLLTESEITKYFHSPGTLSNLTGDFLTQFYYYIAFGPAILSILLTLLFIIVYRVFSQFIKLWAYIPSIIFVFWEAGRECNLLYPLSGTISFIGWGLAILLALRLIRKRRKFFSQIIALIALVSFWLFGYGAWKDKLIDYPNLRIEKMLSADSELYFSRRDNLNRIVTKNESEKNHFFSYYYNILHGKDGNLPAKLMYYYQPASKGMFLPINPQESYLSIYAANEVWFELGDMTMAEHAAMLGMIFSPKHIGSRAIKRLAEINLINGDDAAAMKYLRMLQKTLLHKKWAENRIPGKQSDNIKRWIENRRKLIAKTDTLRTSSDIQRSLRNLLKSNPKNYMARDYLLCYDLLNKEIKSFADDYSEYASDMLLNGIYAEAMLIYIAGKDKSIVENVNFRIPLEKIKEFNEYTKIYEENSGNGNKLLSKYGKSYWFYFHYAKIISKI